MPRAVPARRYDPAMQNYIYQGKPKPSPQGADENPIARFVRKLRQALTSPARDENGSS